MEILAKPVKVAFEVSPEKAQEFRKQLYEGETNYKSLKLKCDKK